MMNLFNSFDPLILNLPVNLLLNILFIMIIIMMKKMMNNQFMEKINTMLIKLLLNLNFKNNKSMLSLFSSIMLLMLMFNMSNLFPMNLSQSTNMSVNLNFTLIMWMMNIIIVMKNHNIFFMNLTPSNSPILILLVINLIEINSLIFQIISLTMRLTINMMLGHIIIHLMNNYSSIILYLMIEMFIIIIQTYIFIMLNMLNFNNNL